VNQGAKNLVEKVELNFLFLLKEQERGVDSVRLNFDSWGIIKLNSNYLFSFYGVRKIRETG